MDRLRSRLLGNFVRCGDTVVVLLIGDYRVYTPFVPFGLRPSIHGRVLGSTRALLVGDFVDKSESLWDRVRRNLASYAISSLFETTLGGWRTQAYAANSVRGPVAAALEEARFCRDGNPYFREGLRR